MSSIVDNNINSILASNYSGYRLHDASHANAFIKSPYDNSSDTLLTSEYNYLPFSTIHFHICELVIISSFACIGVLCTSTHGQPKCILWRVLFRECTRDKTLPRATCLILSPRSILRKIEIKKKRSDYLSFPSLSRYSIKHNFVVRIVIGHFFKMTN